MPKLQLDSWIYDYSAYIDAEQTWMGWGNLLSTLVYHEFTTTRRYDIGIVITATSGPNIGYTNTGAIMLDAATGYEIGSGAHDNQYSATENAGTYQAGVYMVPNGYGYTTGNFTLQIRAVEDDGLIPFDIGSLSSLGLGQTYHVPGAFTPEDRVDKVSFTLASDTVIEVGLDELQNAHLFTGSTSISATGGTVYSQSTANGITTYSLSAGSYTLWMGGSYSHDEAFVEYDTNINILNGAPIAGSVSIGNVTISEGNSGTKVATFTVTREGGTAAFAVNYATLNLSATAGTDYLASNGTLNFGVGVNRQTVSVTINGDTTVEPDETFIVDLSAATNGATIVQAFDEGWGTIADDDGPQPAGSVSISDVTIVEGSGGTRTAYFTVTRTGGTAPFTVNYATANDTATAGSDYVAATGTLNFGSGVVFQNIAVTINGDATIESAQQFLVNLSSPTNGATIGDGQGRGTITDDDTGGSVSIGDVTITEGNAGTQNATFTLTRTGNPGAFSVNYATANGTATAGSDYVATSGTVDFASGVNSQAVTVVINGDTTIEATEQFVVNLSGATNGATISDGQGLGTVVDDDTAGEVSISDVTLTEGNAGTQNATFTVSRTGGPAAFAVNYGTTNGTATAGSDYVATSGTLNFGTNIYSQTVTVVINGDTTVEPNEAFFVNLSGATNGATIFDGQGLGTINDDDTPGSVSIGDVTLTEGDAGTQNATFTVTRIGGPAAFAVNYATANGTATAGSDYVASSGTLNFASGVTTQTLTVAINGDTFSEANETYFVNLSGATNGTTISDAQGLGTIFDNDTDDYADSFSDVSSPFGSVVVGGASMGNIEVVGDHDWFLVALTSGVTVTINLQGSPTSSGTLSDTYLRLYNAAGGLIAQDDDSGDGTNSLLVYTPTTSGNYYLEASAYNDAYSGTYNIGVSGPGAGSVSIGDVTITEGNAGTQTATFTVTRTGGTAAFAVGYATANSTATAGSDYVATSGTLNFGANVNTQTVSVTINGDTTVEPNETFFVNLSGATNGATITDSQGLGTINNDDTAALFTEGPDIVTLTTAGGTWHALGGNDSVTGTSGTDAIYGEAGNDTLNGAGGADQLRGEAGNDTLTVDSLDTVVDGGADIDTVNLSGAGMVLNLGYINVEIVNGTSGSDQVDGSVGTTGTLTLNGLGGNDTLTGGTSGDSLSGGDAGDSLYGNAGNDTLNGGAGIDFLNGGADSDTINGGTENDAIYGEAGNDTINGDAGNEYGFGGAGNDSMNGGAGNDYLVGDSNVIGETGITGLDTLVGDADSDTLIGGYLSDSLNGGLGNDALYGDFDDANAASNPGSADTLIGGAGTDFMFGGGGNDSLVGDADSDTLIGGSENDTMNGGEGSDSYYGKAGVDTFAFSDNWGIDGVWDFADGSEIFDLTAVTGLTTFAQLTITNQSAPGINYADVAFGVNHIYVVGVTAAQITAADFLL